MSRDSTRVYAKRKTPSVKTEHTSTYILLNLNSLNESLKAISVQCPKCKRNNLKYEIVSFEGLGCAIQLACTTCREGSTFHNSTKSGHFYNINLQFIYAMRCIGKGRAGANTFCDLMNLLKPPKTFLPYRNSLLKVVEEAACDSMNSWLDNVKAIERQESCTSGESNEMDVDTNTADSIVDTTAAFDGTWQRRGHRSKNGVVCATSVLNNKVIDVQEFSQFCHCKNKKNHSQGCIAFKGNSGSMEVDGVKLIYERSVGKKIRYMNFLGDGDSRAFNAISEMKPYGENVQIQKLECVGHVQKRMGTRLRKLKKDKQMNGKNGITNNQIDQIQNYYGLAIRQNTSSVKDMQVAIWAMFHHMMDEHTTCPKNKWCKYHTEPNYRKKNPVSKDAMMKIRPIFDDLTKDYLLRRCVHGGTQNANESFNSVLWSRIPKNTFVQLSTLRLGMYDTVLTFNDGSAARVKVLRKLGIETSPRLLHKVQTPKKNEKITSNAPQKKQLSPQPGTSKDYSPGAF